MAFYWLKQSFLLNLSAIFLISCTNSQLEKDYAVVGIGELIADSKQISQGKFAILEMQGAEIPELPCEYLEDYRDEIENDDILNICIYHSKRIDLMEAVDSINQQMGFPVMDGWTQLPALSPLAVAGLTLAEAQQKIQQAYQEQIKEIEVKVDYRFRLRNKVEIIGGLGEPMIPVDGKMRLYEVLSKAKVTDQINLFKSYLVRDDQKIAIDFSRLVLEGDKTQNIVMRGGDRLFLAPIDEVNMTVMGEVHLPQIVPLRQGTLSLSQALGESGGLTRAGSRRCIQVIRGNLPCPKIYVIRWQDLYSANPKDLLLIPGDTIYVSEKPLFKWNRFVSQLIPSVTLFTQGIQVYTIARICGADKILLKMEGVD
jgi:polysaccharide export outer membrane protein